jgi:hypothetical protein
MTALAGAFTTALLHFFWQGALATALLWIVLRCLHASSLRYAACCATLVLLTAMPGVTTWKLLNRGVSATPVITTSAAAHPLVPVTPQTAPRPRRSLALVEKWALPLWALGVVFFSLRMAWGCSRVATLRR